MSRIVVGMMISTTTPSRQPIATVMRIDDRDRGEREMEQKLVRLLVGGLAIVARDRDLELGRHDAALDRLEALHHVFGDFDRVLALALGDSEADGGPALQCRRGDPRQVQARWSTSAEPTTTSATSLT